MSWRLVLVVVTMLALLLASWPAYAAPPGGTGVEDAVDLSGMKSGSLAPGEEAWYKLWDNGKPLGVVINYTPWTPPSSPTSEADPMVGFRVLAQVKQGLDWRYIEVGRSTESGLGRGVKYWRGGSSYGQRYYIQVQNDGVWGVDYAIAFVGEAFPPAKLDINPTKVSVIDVSALTKDIEQWVGQDVFIIKAGDTVIYTDPYQLKKDEPKADLILVSHEHGDHCSATDLARITKPGTVVIGVAACLAIPAVAELGLDYRVIKPYEKMNVKGVSIETIPAYNTNKFRSPGVPYHPKDSGMVGFIFVANGIRYYHTGDGDLIPEMKGINPDVLFLPVGGRYNMDVDEALEAVKMIGPKVAVPMHFGGSTGTPEDGATFKSKATVPVVVFEPAP